MKVCNVCGRVVKGNRRNKKHTCTHCRVHPRKFVEVTITVRGRRGLVQKEAFSQVM